MLICFGFTGATIAKPELEQQNPNQDGLLLQAIKKEVCEFMKRKHPHIKDWKKGKLPTTTELQTLVKIHSELEEELSRVLMEFLTEAMSEPKKHKPYSSSLR